MDTKLLAKMGCLSKLTPPSFDVSGIFPDFKSDVIRDATVRVAKDTAYIAIGFSVLAFQKLQVRRREYFGANK